LMGINYIIIMEFPLKNIYVDSKFIYN